MKAEYKCFSSHFVNKQNVRSLGNIIPLQLLKSQNISYFIEKIFVLDKYNLGELSHEMLTLFSTLRQNIITHGKNNFKSYFSKEPSKSKLLTPVSKEVIFSGCWQVMLDTIPSYFIGCNHNMKLFKTIIRNVIFCGKGEHLAIFKLVKNWSINEGFWKQFPEDIRNSFLIQFIEWILVYLLGAIISLNFYVTTTKLDTDERKLWFFHKNDWQSFYDKKIYNLALLKIVRRYEDYCIGKKRKKQYNTCEILEIKKLKKDIPKLHLILKCNNDFRPIVLYRPTQSLIEKNKIKQRLEFLRKLNGRPAEKIEDKYLKLYQKWLHLGMPRLYFVKTDLSNAFGAIDRQLLIKIIAQAFANLQKREANNDKKRKMAQHYQDLVSELRKPLLVRCGSTIFEWKQGLVQGYKYSPALSELYYKYLDNIVFSDLCMESETSIRLFIRVVDDYLFITDTMDDAFSFLRNLSKYKNVNYEKTVVNFDHQTIKSNINISFLGYIYDTTNLQVSRALNIYSGQMCYKLAISKSVENIHKFLESRIGQSAIPINGHIFNFYYNNEQLIWNHVFITLCLSANKFCTILSMHCDMNEMVQCLNVYKKYVTVKLCNAIICTLMQNKPPYFKFYFCINHFRYLSFNALLLCAKETPKCNKLVPLIKDHMAKSNCMFGKWRKHASWIDADGVCDKEAVREICKKAEYKNVVKQFDKLPLGFQCYNHKSRK